MIWKLFLLFTYTQWVLSDDNIFNTHRNIRDVMHDTDPIDVANVDVGEPLFLTPLIQNNKIKQARKAARVENKNLLPGVESYAGYLNVNKKYNGNLWFWYFPVAKQNVSETPLIIWLQGTIGLSSLSGVFSEIGPFSLTKDNKVKASKYSWGRNHSLLFFDSPVGAGYSFTDEGGYAENQRTIGLSLYSALQQFLVLFPELRTAPLFIAGESYAGKHVPSLAIQIHWHKDLDEPINLQGLAIGNGFIDPISLQRHSYFVREVGLMDDKVADIMKAVESNITQAIQDGDTIGALELNVKKMQLLIKESHMWTFSNYLSNEKIPTKNNLLEFIQSPEMRLALHVGNTSFMIPIPPTLYVFEHLKADFMKSVKPWLEELLDHYRVLLYSGHLDCMVPYHASVNTYKSLKFSGATEYNNTERMPWAHNDTLAGYYKVGGKLTEVMVRGAGHGVPVEKPSEALGLLSAFVRGVPLDTDTVMFVN